MGTSGEAGMGSLSLAGTGLQDGSRREADLGLYLSAWLSVDWVHGCRVQSDCVQNQTGTEVGRSHLGSLPVRVRVRCICVSTMA